MCPPLTTLCAHLCPHLPTSPQDMCPVPTSAQDMCPVPKSAQDMCPMPTSAHAMCPVPTSAHAICCPVPTSAQDMCPVATSAYRNAPDHHFGQEVEEQVGTKQVMVLYTGTDCHKLNVGNWRYLGGSNSRCFWSKTVLKSFRIQRNMLKRKH